MNLQPASWMGSGEEGKEGRRVWGKRCTQIKPGNVGRAILKGGWRQPGELRAPFTLQAPVQWACWGS